MGVYMTVIETIKEILAKANKALSVREITQKRIDGGYVPSDRSFELELKQMHVTIVNSIKNRKKAGQPQIFQKIGGMVMLVESVSRLQEEGYCSDTTLGDNSNSRYMESVIHILKNAYEPLSAREIAQKRIERGLSKKNINEERIELSNKLCQYRDRGVAPQICQIEVPGLTRYKYKLADCILPQKHEACDVSDCGIKDSVYRGFVELLKNTCSTCLLGANEELDGKLHLSVEVSFRAPFGPQCVQNLEIICRKV